MCVRSITIALTGVAVTPPVLHPPLRPCSGSYGGASDLNAPTVAQLKEWITADLDHRYSFVKIFDAGQATEMKDAEALSTNTDVMVYMSLNDTTRWSAFHQNDLPRTSEERGESQKKADDALLAQLDTHVAFLEAQLAKVGNKFAEVERSLQRMPVDMVVRAVDDVKGIRAVEGAGESLADRLHAERLVPAITRAMEELPRQSEELKAVEAAIHTLIDRRNKQRAIALPEGHDARLAAMATRLKVVQKSANDAELQRRALSTVWHGMRFVQEHVVDRFMVIESLPQAYADACALLKARVTLRRALHRVNTFLKPAYEAVEEEHRAFVQRWRTRFPAHIVPNLYDAQVSRIYVVDDVVAKAVDSTVGDDGGDNDAADLLLQQHGLLSSDAAVTRLKRELASLQDALRITRQRNDAMNEATATSFTTARAFLADLEAADRCKLEDAEVFQRKLLCSMPAMATWASPLASHLADVVPSPAIVSSPAVISTSPSSSGDAGAASQRASPSTPSPVVVPPALPEDAGAASQRASPSTPSPVVVPPAPPEDAGAASRRPDYLVGRRLTFTRSPTSPLECTVEGFTLRIQSSRLGNGSARLTGVVKKILEEVEPNVWECYVGK